MTVFERAQKSKHPDGVPWRKRLAIGLVVVTVAALSTVAGIAAARSAAWATGLGTGVAVLTVLIAVSTVVISAIRRWRRRR